MKNLGKPNWGLLIVVGAVVGCLFVFGVLDTLFVADTTTGEEVAMLQPGGVNASRDNLNSQSNVNNSQSNTNNAQAEAEIMRARAEATLMVAQSCDLRNDCHAPAGTATKYAFVWILVGGLIVLFIVGLIFKMVFSE